MHKDYWHTWDQCYKTFLHLLFMKGSYKLKSQSLADLFSLIKCLQVRSMAYPRIEHLKDAPLGQAQPRTLD
jgi:hypothetical protein